MTFNPFNWFRSVDSILADFQTKVDALEELSDVLEATAAREREYAAKLLSKASGNEKEARRATRIASKIQEFLV